MTRALIIPAAGVGSRLRADVPKALYPLDGRPLLDRLLELYRPHVDRIVLVVRPADRAAFERHAPLRALPHALVEQPTPTGMLDAILLARPLLVPRAPDRIWITWCDQVAISTVTVQRLRLLCDARDAAPLLFPTVRRADPYIHIVRDDGRITGIHHRREGDEMPPVGESDAGLFSLSHEAFFSQLPRFAEAVEPGGVTRERNFLPFIPWLAARAEVRTYRCASELEAVGVNTPDDAAQLASHLRR